MNDAIHMTYDAIVPLPSLVSCPFCQMTNVVREANPVLVCRDCGKDFWPVGVIVVRDEPDPDGAYDD